MNLDCKVIVVTGAGQGLGRAIAVLLAEKGAKLALIDLKQTELEETARLVMSAGSKACAYVADVANEQMVIAAFDAIVRDFGAVHGLVNNAGITRDGLLVSVRSGKVSKRLSLEHWQQVIDVNLTGTFLCGREAATRMIDGGCEGAIVNISSIARDGNIGLTNYSASKAGVAAMTAVWAKELSHHGIRAGAVAPGVVDTAMVRGMKPDALEEMASGIPLGRMGEPAEIAQAVCFILENDYFNGRVIEIDGGLRF